MKNFAYQKPQKEQVIVVTRWLSQIELFLLGKLGCHTVVKVIEHCNHGCWNKCSNYVDNRNMDHILLRTSKNNDYFLLFTTKQCEIRELVIYMP